MKFKANYIDQCGNDGGSEIIDAASLAGAYKTVRDHLFEINKYATGGVLLGTLTTITEDR